MISFLDILKFRKKIEINFRKFLKKKKNKNYFFNYRKKIQHIRIFLFLSFFYFLNKVLEFFIILIFNTFKMFYFLNALKIHKIFLWELKFIFLIKNKLTIFGKLPITILWFFPKYFEISKKNFEIMFLKFLKKLKLFFLII